ncbi:30S ribosomal protein S8 [candidate division WS5 bacterium]|uniref:Small ribosomal subunit protein uS8 n=1 Tax=candidate division WS5 bacterium TaxID=2093353 RepID=A0A419DA90_9BACT|nr:MAG: 30S ribosomal protein S8 [candidate division WS5 bacterium]
MAVNDPIADMLTRIRNAYMAGKVSVLIPDTRIKRDILSVMKSREYIENFSVSKEALGYIDVKLSNKKPRKIERVSKPGCRVYTKKSEIPNVLQGMGMVIVSTSKGVMAGSEAKKQGLGGEIICKIY